MVAYIAEPVFDNGSKRFELYTELGRTEIYLGKAPEIRIDGEPLVGGLEFLKTEVLKEIAQAAAAKNNGSSARAEEILEALGYQAQNVQASMTYDISKDAKKDIKNAFRDWKGIPTKQQFDVLRRHGLAYEKSGQSSHGKISYDDSGFVTVSSSPSDENTGIQIAHKIIRLLDGRYGFHNSA